MPGEDSVSAPADPAHVHHWIIGGQSGPSSQGVCKICGAEKSFENGFKRSLGQSTARKQA
jgi:hypothetical protein